MSTLIACGSLSHMGGRTQYADGISRDMCRSAPDIGAQQAKHRENTESYREPTHTCGRGRICGQREGPPTTPLRA